MAVTFKCYFRKGQMYKTAKEIYGQQFTKRLLPIKTTFVKKFRSLRYPEYFFYSR